MYSVIQHNRSNRCSHQGSVSDLVHEPLPNEGELRCERVNAWIMCQCSFDDLEYSHRIDGRQVPSRFWLTFNQATNLGGKIRKGEKSSPVIFWNVGEDRETITPDGAKKTLRSFLLRYYSVFNLVQTEGIDLPASVLQETRTNNSIETCEKIVANMPNPPAFEQSDKAWYSPNSDAVGMPARGLFYSPEGYYSTLFHELAHSTGHAKRLHRDNFDSPVSFGSESYSKE